MHSSESNRTSAVVLTARPHVLHPLDRRYGRRSRSEGVRSAEQIIQRPIGVLGGYRPAPLRRRSQRQGASCACALRKQPGSTEHAARHRQQVQRREAISARLGAGRTGLAAQMSNSAAYEGGSVPPDEDEEDWDAANADAGTGTGTEENSEAESYETEDELNDDVRWPCVDSHAQLDLGRTGGSAAAVGARGNT